MVPPTTTEETTKSFQTSDDKKIEAVQQLEENSENIRALNNIIASNLIHINDEEANKTTKKEFLASIVDARK